MLKNDTPSDDALTKSELLNSDIQYALDAIPNSDHYLIALSGGLDSVALLQFVVPFLLHQCKQVEVVHVHHGLSDNADEWVTHCQALCERVQVLCHIEYVSVFSDGEGIEAAARKARYQAFRKYMRVGTILLQGHHMNDQAETVLMRMMRGAGPEGLSGIPHMRVFAQGHVFRPWLSLSRELLESEMLKQPLSWVEDESNIDLSFDRNFIRHEILPRLLSRSSNSLQALSRVAEKAKDAQNFMVSWCQQQMPSLMSSQYADEQAVNLSVLVNYNEQEQRLLLRYWLDLFRVRHPAEKVFDRLWSEVIAAKGDAQPEVRWQSYRIRRFNGCLFLLSATDVNEEAFDLSVDLQLSELPYKLVLPAGTLLIELMTQDEVQFHRARVSEGGVCFVRPPSDDEVATVRSRLGGEAITLSRSQHATALKKVMQSHKVLPWKRSRLPLLFYNKALVYTAMGLVDDAFVPTKDEQALKLSYNESAA